MSLSSRRRFISQLAVAGPVAIAAGSFTNFDTKEKFVHHVYFWLKKP